MVPPINLSFLFKAYLWQYLKVVLTVIFKFKIPKEVNIHNNIQKNNIQINSLKASNIFAISKFFYNNKIEIISKKCIISSSTINQLN